MCGAAFRELHQEEDDEAGEAEEDGAGRGALSARVPPPGHCGEHPEHLSLSPTDEPCN